MKRLVVVVTLIILFSAANTCVADSKLFIKEGTVTNSKGETLVYYLGQKSKDKLSKSLFIGIQGSGRESAKRFEFWSQFAPSNCDILSLEKYSFDNEELFYKTECRQRRIEDIELVIDYVLTNIYDKKDLENIIILGGSDGGVIVPEIANRVKEITHLVVLVAGGYSQGKEFEILLEKELESNEKGMFSYIGIKNQEELRTQFDKMRKNPSNTKFWLGHTYKRWNSYIDYKPKEYVEKLKIPVLYCMGTADKSLPYESLQYLVDNLKDRENFTFQIIPGLDHGFRDKQGNSKREEVINNIIMSWYTENLN